MQELVFPNQSGNELAELLFSLLTCCRELLEKKDHDHDESEVDPGKASHDPIAFLLESKPDRHAGNHPPSVAWRLERPVIAAIGKIGDGGPAHASLLERSKVEGRRSKRNL